MFEKFLQEGRIKRRMLSTEHRSIFSVRDQTLKTLFEECGGLSFLNGLYRVHDANSSGYWSNLVAAYFPEYKDRIAPFGYDWMGRQFAAILTNPDLLLMFDPATAESFHLERSLVLFHNEDFITERNDLFSQDQFNDALRRLDRKEIGYNDCIGYKTPLFLGGIDTIENLEITNLEVYWEIQRQVYQQIRNLPPGTKIGKIRFE